jgi:hypothetical protein
MVKISLHLLVGGEFLDRAAFERRAFVGDFADY